MIAATKATLKDAQFPSDKPTVERLFLAYAEAINVDLAFQSFDDELKALPGKYGTEKRGALLLASTNPTPNINDATTYGHRNTSHEKTTDAQSQQSIGCVALRAIHDPTREDGAVCELKRLYVAPQARGLGVGKMLLEGAVERARVLGYREMVLDTLVGLEAAVGLYREAGFGETGGYYDNPLVGVVYFRKVL
ncbi:acyl-CoA N-acyltransferase [Massarina eburnea CBS 473.64]|uniref:Acyl-CoA N-acyltransferase n=1 Tax=Massarina eburnea CBS 473.64 TaxID=1395130 RepID=A0A6A6RVC0_9PLEO|nr:acyl-CoA N-acyltransferase [Massarina eburnea CBS 473.64]